MDGWIAMRGKKRGWERGGSCTAQLSKFEYNSQKDGSYFIVVINVKSELCTYL